MALSTTGLNGAEARIVLEGVAQVLDDRAIPSPSLRKVAASDYSTLFQFISLQPTLPLPLTGCTSPPLGTLVPYSICIPLTKVAFVGKCGGM